MQEWHLHSQGQGLAGGGGWEGGERLEGKVRSMLGSLRPRGALAAFDVVDEESKGKILKEGILLLGRFGLYDLGFFFGLVVEIEK